MKVAAVAASARVLLGIVACFLGGGLAALELVPCNNHFSLSAENINCRSPLYWICGGYTAFGLGVVTIVAFAVSRAVNRKR